MIAESGKAMSLLTDFLRKKAPRPGAEIPAYYRRALAISEILLAVYFPLNVILFFWSTRQAQWMPIAMFVMVMAGLMLIGRLPMRVSFGLYAAITLVWSFWYVKTFGWSCGGQHFLILLLFLTFFNIYEPPWLKLFYFVALISFRMLLFSYSLSFPPLYALSTSTSIAFQTLNSLMFFIMMAALCILFSSNLQETERKLRLDNQELHKEAGTDPLTQLPNRRAMLNDIDLYQLKWPGETFSVAIADIDFFKKVNDTYGHNCGDYTLRMLADLFREKAGEAYSVCRWGGEEFCFFLPRKNLDEAGRVLFDICNDVRHMKLRFEDVEFSITITVGVEENDFTSPLKDILEQADQKLYMGKKSGRDQVVI